MSSLPVAYAQALFHAALERGTLEKVRAELPAIEQLVQENAFFTNPTVPGKQQSAMLAELLSGRIDEVTLTFLQLMAERRVMRALPVVRIHFEEFYRRENKEIGVMLRVPYQPSAELLDKLKVYLAECGLYAKEQIPRARIAIAIDTELLGGFSAECNGRIVDASLKKRLAHVGLPWKQGAYLCR